MNYAAMVSMLAKGEATDEIVPQHGASKDSPDLPTAHTSDLPTPKNVSNVEKPPMQIFGDISCSKSSMAFYRLVLLHRRRYSK